MTYISALEATIMLISSFAMIILLPVLAILGLLAALIGLRWGVSRFMHWVVGDGTTSGFSRSLYKISPSASAWYDHMTYRPFKGSPRGWQLRIGRKFGIKKWQI